MTITTLYLMGWFTRLIKPLMAASATGLEADYQLHQIRFLLAFIMLAVGTVALNYDYFIRETLIVSTWVQILLSGYGCKALRPHDARRQLSVASGLCRQFSFYTFFIADPYR